MFRSMKLNRGALLTVCFGVLVLILLLAVDRFTGAGVAAAPDCTGATQSQRIAFLARYGWEIDPKSEAADPVIIPQSFDAVFTQYNDVQTAQGFDLTAYAGKRVTRYTYTVKNYPDCEEEVHANLLVCDGIIIGGDLCTWAADGFLHGFDDSITTGVLFGESALSFAPQAAPASVAL